MADSISLLACSGTHVSEWITVARLIGNFSFAVGVTCILFEIILAWKVRIVFLPLIASALLLAVHPRLWSNPDKGDCGNMLRTMSLLWSVGSVLIFAWALSMFVKASKPAAL